MALVNLKTILEPAEQKKYAVGSFNVINSIFLESIMEAAVQNNSPVIISIAEVHLPFVTLEHICPSILKMAEMYDVQVALNFDHGLTMEGIKRAIDNGFTSIMYDGSKLDFDNNVAETRKVVELCKPHNISVEAELGAVGGSEGGELVGDVNPAKYTDIDEAVQFVEQTGIDALAVAIGNSHGAYKGIPELDFDLLDGIHKKTGIPLVLHGGSGLSTEDFKRTIQLGISKINFFTGMSQVALTTTADFFKGELGQYNDYLNLMQSVKEDVRDCVSGQMDIFGSKNMA